MDYQMPLPAIDLTMGYSHDEHAPQLQGAGGYLEFRRNMYSSPLYGGKRFIHMGIDIWGPAGAPVYAPADGIVWGLRNNSNALDYGPTVVTRHAIGDSYLYALFGHLSLKNLDELEAGMPVKSGMRLGELGSRSENGGWIPHLHFQLSVDEPEAPDMPGVVSPDELEKAIKRHPDPRIILGPIYL